MSYLGLSVMDRFVVPQVAIIDKKGMVRAQSAPMGTTELQTPDYLRGFIKDLLAGGTGLGKSGTPAKPATPVASAK